MCNASGIEFVTEVLPQPRVRDQRVLEVGSYDVNGTVRPLINALHPAEYIGVDITPGPGVDEVLSVHELVEHFGPQRFDLVLATEMLEHIADWRSAVLQMKLVLADGGTLIITTRSPGFGYHGYPQDFWRFTRADFEVIFADMCITHLADDALSPGVFLAAEARTWRPGLDLSDFRAHSILSGRPALEVPHFATMRARSIIVWQRTGPGRRRLARAIRRRLPGRAQPR